jgi:hypothetical protein
MVVGRKSIALRTGITTDTRGVQSPFPSREEAVRETELGEDAVSPADPSLPGIIAGFPSQGGSQETVPPDPTGADAGRVWIASLRPFSRMVWSTPQASASIEHRRQGVSQSQLTFR